MKRILSLLAVLGVPICGLAQQSITYKYDAAGNQTARIVTTQSQSKVSKHPQKSPDDNIISDVGCIEKHDVSVNVSVDSKLKIPQNIDRRGLAPRFKIQLIPSRWKFGKKRQFGKRRDFRSNAGITQWRISFANLY